MVKWVLGLGLMVRIMLKGFYVMMVVSDGGLSGVWWLSDGVGEWCW